MGVAVIPTLLVLVGVAAAIPLRRNFVWYQFTLLSAFLVALTLSGTLDNTMPIYVIAALLPCLLRCKKYDPVCVVFCAGMIGYLSLGLYQSPFDALVTFLSRFCQFFGLIFILGVEEPERSTRSYESVLYLGLTLEVILAIYLLFNGTMGGGKEVEGIRLVANSQPITGNLAIALLPLAGYLFFQRFRHDGSGRFRILLVATCFFLLTILSGTRGYVLLYGCCYVVMAVYYVWDAAIGKIRSHAPYLMFCALSITLLVLIALFQRELIQFAAEILRTGDSLGIRDYENAVVTRTFEGLPLINKVLGIGIGGRWADYPVFVEAAWSIFPEWARASYFDAVGTAVHNYFGNVLILTGLLGVVLFIAVIIWTFRQIASTTSSTRPMRLFLYAYVLGYLVMLYFRWSADCGIGELLMFGYVILLLKPRSHASRPSLLDS